MLRTYEGRRLIYIDVRGARKEPRFLASNVIIRYEGETIAEATREGSKEVARCRTRSFFSFARTTQVTRLLLRTREESSGSTRARARMQFCDRAKMRGAIIENPIPRGGSIIPKPISARKTAARSCVRDRPSSARRRINDELSCARR